MKEGLLESQNHIQRSFSTQRVVALSAILGQQYLDEERDWYKTVLEIIQAANKSALDSMALREEAIRDGVKAKFEYERRIYECTMQNTRYKLIIKNMAKKTIPTSYVIFGALTWSLTLIMGLAFIFMHTFK